jgi:hypothetical protein
MPTKIEGVKHYNKLETALELKRTPQTIRNYIKAGKIKPNRIGTRLIFTKAEIDKTRRENEYKRV